MSDTAQVAVSGVDTAQTPIYNLVNALAGAWNRGDAAGFASLFGEQADLIHLLGGHIAGRAAIEEVHRNLFAGLYAGSQIEYRFLKLKPIGQQVIVVFLHQRLVFKRGDGQLVEAHTRPTLTLRLGPDGYRIAVLQNTMVSDQPAPLASAEPVVEVEMAAEASAPKAESEPAGKPKLTDKKVADTKPKAKGKP